MSDQPDSVAGSYDPRNPQLRTFFDARARFIDGNDTPRDYLERCLQVIDEREPTVRAWVTLNTDNARKAADQSSARYKSGKPISPIDGIPVGIKDVANRKFKRAKRRSTQFFGRLAATAARRLS
jgi:Asp-tRNA(Asn)/Glu-tRNA(Gln) amidotransferase A subunit family amidase